MDPHKLVIVFYNDEQLIARSDKEPFIRALFEDEMLTDGGPIENVFFNKNGKQAFIYYKDADTVDRVMHVDNGDKNKKITVGSYKFTLKRSNAVKTEENEAATTVKGEKTNSIGAASSVYQYRRPVIIDGNNVAISHGRQRLFSCRGLVLAIDYFTNLGHTDVKAIVPRFRRSTKDSDMPTMNPELLDILDQRDQLVWTPNQVYDDIILKLAVKKNAVVVSNDRYRDFGDPAIISYLKDLNLIEYTLDGDNFIVADMPFGRSKPSLEDTLTRRPSQMQQEAPIKQRGARRSVSVERTRIQFGSATIERDSGHRDADRAPIPGPRLSRPAASRAEIHKQANNLIQQGISSRRSSVSYLPANLGNPMLSYRGGTEIPVIPPVTVHGYYADQAAHIPRYTNQVRIQSFFLYDHLRKKRREIEKEYQVSLKFKGSGDPTMRDSDDSGDEGDEYLTRYATAKHKPKKIYRVAIEGDPRRIDNCKRYFEVLRCLYRL